MGNQQLDFSATQTGGFGQAKLCELQLASQMVGK